MVTIILQEKGAALKKEESTTLQYTHLRASHENFLFEPEVINKDTLRDSYAGSKFFSFFFKRQYVTKIMEKEKGGKWIFNMLQIKHQWIVDCSLLMGTSK